MSVVSVVCFVFHFFFFPLAFFSGAGHTSTSWPCCRSAMAAVRPPIPAPTTRTFKAGEDILDLTIGICKELCVSRKQQADGCFVELFKHFHTKGGPRT